MLRIEKALEELVSSAELPRGHHTELAAYWDATLTCHVWTEGYGDWFGRSRKTMQGIKKSDLLESLFDPSRPYIDDALAGKKQKFERRQVRSDGSIRDTRVYYVPDIDQSGGVNGFVSVIADVTTQKGSDGREVGAGTRVPTGHQEKQRCDAVDPPCELQCADCRDGPGQLR